MNKALFSLSFLIIISFQSYSQSITWEKIFVQSGTDVFRSIKEVPAGGYITAGCTSNWTQNDTDAFVVRLDTMGDTLWTRTYDNGKKDLFYKVYNTSDGGFILCGYSSSFNGGTSDDAYYMKLDSNGSTQWSGSYGAAGTKERAQDIIQTADGGYAVVGYTNNGQPSYNSFLLKLDANGAQSWVKKYGGSTTYDDANAVRQLADSGFIMAGQTVPTAGNLSGEIYLVRTNANGDTIWTKFFGSGVMNASENAESVELTSDGGFIICGSTNGLGVGVGDDNGYLVKTDSGGAVQWYKTFGGSSPDDFHTVVPTNDGGYILTGTTQSNASIISDIWLFKTDSNGDSTWARTFGGANHDHGYSGIPTSDGGYALCGYSASFGFNYENAYVAKVDSAGLLYNHLFYTTVTTLVSPVNGACGSPNSLITVTVRNFGDTAVSSIPITIEITGALTQTIQETRVGTLVPPNYVNYTFTTTINTSAGGTFNFHCYTGNNNTVYPAMNWCDSTIVLLGQPAAPVVFGDTTCGPGSVTLTANSPDPVEWYDSAVGGSLIGSGNSYTTTISSTTTFYVQSSNSCGVSPRVAVTAVVGTVADPPMVTSADRCGPGEVTLQATASDPISWWDDQTGGIMLQGDTTTFLANVTSTTIFYVEAGTGSGCPSSRVPVTATVNPLPDAEFTTNASAVCLGDSFQFVNLSTGAATFEWDFGNGTGTSSLSDPSYTYSDTGTYSVQLIAISAQTCSDTITIMLEVNPSPSVSFSSDVSSGCLPLTVNFVNNTSSATSYLWDFGDGGTSTAINPSYDYMTEGVFSVTLVASVGTCTDTDSVATMISTYTPPTFDFGTDSIISNAVTYELDAGPDYFTYLWNNGSTTQTITADTNGTYCITVSDTNACTATDCVYVLLDAASVNNESMSSNVIVYPNPASNRLHVYHSVPGNGSSSIRIFDAMGRVVLTRVFSDPSIELSVNNWPRGVYVIEITSTQTAVRKKLVLN